MPDDDEYRVQAHVEPAEPPPAAQPPKVGVFARLAEVRQQAPSVPPKWTFFSGVFDFPWQAEVWLRWTYLSLGCSAMLLLAVAVMHIAGSMSGPFGAMVAFFALPEIWITLWTLSYAASCGMQILEDTANGNSSVLEWPEPNWREWAMKLYYLLNLVAVSAAVSYGLGCLLEWTTGASFWWGIAVGLPVLFPIMLLSTFYEHSVWYLISPALLRELARRWPAALQCFALLAGVWLVPAGSVLLGVFVTVFGHLAAGPLVAAAVFISARLLGRLMWHMQQGKTKSKQPARSKI